MATEAGKEGKAVANLRYERDHFVAFAFASADAFLEINADLKILYATGAVQRLLDRAPEELAGQPLLDLIVPQSVPLVRAALDIAQHQGVSGPLAYALPLTSPPGSQRLAPICRSMAAEHSWR